MIVLSNGFHVIKTPQQTLCVRHSTITADGSLVSIGVMERWRKGARSHSKIMHIQYVIIAVINKQRLVILRKASVGYTADDYANAERCG